MCVSITEMFCPTLHHDRVTSNHERTAVGSGITLQCEQGKLFNTGRGVQRIECVQKYIWPTGVIAVWSEDPQDCHGR